MDAVLNHMFGADATERFKVREVDPNDRTRAITGPFDIEVEIFYPIPNGYLTSVVGFYQIYVQWEEQQGIAFGGFYWRTESHWNGLVSSIALSSGTLTTSRLALRLCAPTSFINFDPRASISLMPPARKKSSRLKVWGRIGLPV